MIISVVLALTTPTGDAVPTWSQVEPIIASQCATCHRPGGEGPFRLDRASDLAARRSFSAAVIRSGLMPPWLPGDEGIPRHGRGDLTPAQRELLLAWLDGGAPHPPGATAVPEAPDTGNVWTALPLESGYDIPAESEVVLHAHTHNLRTFALPLANDQTSLVTGLRWSSPTVNALHGVAVAADPSGQSELADELEHPPGYHMSGDIGTIPAGSLGVLGVGARTLQWPEGFGVEIPSASTMVTEVSYRPTGRELPLEGTLEVQVAEPGDDLRRIESVMVMVPWIKLAAGEKRAEQATLTIPYDLDVIAVTPRGDHFLRSMRLVAVQPDGRQMVLADYPDWDPHWLQTEILQTPLRLPAGTRLNLDIFVDNTDDNPRNLSYPARDRTLGRFTGVDGVMLHAAPADPERQDELRAWLQERRR